jgi:nitrate reductase alpha subunit
MAGTLHRDQAAATVINFARQWAKTAELSDGRCSSSSAPGVNHWYHNNLIYRACITRWSSAAAWAGTAAGWNHYVGQEKARAAGDLGADRLWH